MASHQAALEFHLLAGHLSVPVTFYLVDFVLAPVVSTFDFNLTSVSFFSCVARVSVSRGDLVTCSEETLGGLGVISSFAGTLMLVRNLGVGANATTNEYRTESKISQVEVRLIT